MVANEDVTKRLSFGEISQKLHAKLQVDASEVDRVIAEGKDAPEAFVTCVIFAVASSVFPDRRVSIYVLILVAHGAVNWRCRALEVLVGQCAQRQGAIQGNAKEQVRVSASHVYGVFCRLSPVVGNAYPLVVSLLQMRSRAPLESSSGRSLCPLGRRTCAA